MNTFSKQLHLAYKMYQWSQKYIYAVSEICVCFLKIPIGAKSGLGFEVQLHFIHGHFYFIIGHGHDSHDKI